MTDTPQKTNHKHTHILQQPASPLSKVDQQLTNHHSENAIQQLKHILEQTHPETQPTVLGWGSVA